MSEAAIEVSGLRKSYKDVEALCGIDLEVEAGTILGLLGPNGAGKTTAVRILATLLPPTAGSARVVGLDVVEDASKLRSQIGLAGQYAAVDENLTGFENLEMVGRLYHLGRAKSGQRATELLERFDARRGRQTGWPRPTPAACAGASTSPRRSSPGRRCCSSTSPPPGSIRAAGSVSGR